MFDADEMEFRVWQPNVDEEEHYHPKKIIIMVSEIIPYVEPAPLENLDRNNILIIDSDTRMLESLDRAFQSQGFRVIKHTSGEYGLASVREHQPDLVLVEVDLLDMDGIELCRTVADSSDTCGIPVIVMARSGNQALVRQARSAGCHFFMAKPIDPKSLLHLANEAIAESRSWICD